MISITREELLNAYNIRIYEICEEFDWISVIDGEHICRIVIGILNDKNVETSLNSTKLYKLYSKSVEKLKLSREEWVKEYGIPEIIDIIYPILEKNTK